MNNCPLLAENVICKPVTNDYFDIIILFTKESAQGRDRRSTNYPTGGQSYIQRELCAENYKHRVTRHWRFLSTYLFYPAEVWVNLMNGVFVREKLFPSVSYEYQNLESSYGHYNKIMMII